MKNKKLLLSLLSLLGLVLSRIVLADDSTVDMNNQGIGPVKNAQVGPLDEKLAAQGKTIFETKCAACHKFGERYVGPDIAGVTKRRTPSWIMNMILNPAEMTQKDPIAQELLGTFLTQMTVQNVTEADSRAILEYFRSKDGQ